MKRSHAKLVVLAAALVMGAFSFNSVCAQDMSIWEGKWFKVSIKSTKYFVDIFELQGGGMITEKETTAGYINIWSVDNADKILHSDLYFSDNGSWVSGSIDFNYRSANNLDFLFWNHKFETTEAPEYGGTKVSFWGLRRSNQRHGKEGGFGRGNNENPRKPQMDHKRRTGIF